MMDARLLPYAFARDFALLAHRNGAADGGAIEVWVSDATAPTAIAEVSRRFGRVKLKSMSREALESAIAKAYAGSGGDAAQVIDEYESDLDLAKLMRDMPAVEDLLESADDAPVIRMINALLRIRSRPRHLEVTTGLDEGALLHHERCEIGWILCGKGFYPFQQQVEFFLIELPIKIQAEKIIAEGDLLRHLELLREVVSR